MRIPYLRKTAALLAAAMVCGSASAADDHWQHTGTLYFVGAGMDGKAGVGGVIADVDVNFGDILDNLEFGFMAAWRAERGRWAVVADYSYLTLEMRNNSIGPAGNTRATVDADQTIFELDGAYALTEQLSTYVGLRYWDLGADVQVFGGGPLGEDLAGSGDENWIDPLVGLRYIMPLGERWEIIAKGDIGGFGVASDFTWQAMLLAGWNFTEHATLLFGYRYIDVDYDDGSGSSRILWDVGLGGPSAGLAWRF